MDGVQSRELLISVIIPHLDQLAGLDLCLRSLEAQTLERSRFEIIVVDNGSICRPEALISRYPGVRLLHETSPGPGPARNRGARSANGDILCFIDADCRAHPDWLAVALRALRSAPDGTILGGQVPIWREDETHYSAIEAYESIFNYRQQLHIERHGYSGTGNLVVRRDDFHKAGPFAGILFAEDMEWGRRARSAGCNFKYVPEMIVFHPARSSLKTLCTQWDRQIRHALTYARQKPCWRFHWTIRTLAVLFSPCIHVIRVMTTRRISLSARLKAAAVLLVIRFYRAWRMVTLLRAPTKGVLWNRDVAIGGIERE